MLGEIDIECSSRKCSSKNECQLTEEHETVPKNGRIGVCLTDATAATRGGRSPRSSQPAKGLICHARQMSALGHKRTFNRLHRMSALPPKADIRQHYSDVRFVPKAEDQRGLRVLERPLGRPTRKYLKKSPPSPAGNRASHFRQAILPCSASLGASIVTTLYCASQPGQLKSIGSNLLIVGLR